MKRHCGPPYGWGGGGRVEMLVMKRVGRHTQNIMGRETKQHFLKDWMWNVRETVVKKDITDFNLENFSQPYSHIVFDNFPLSFLYGKIGLKWFWTSRMLVKLLNLTCLQSMEQMVDMVPTYQANFRIWSSLLSYLLQRKMVSDRKHKKPAI
jgi:hypothetical protein